MKPILTILSLIMSFMATPLSAQVTAINPDNVILYDFGLDMNDGYLIPGENPNHYLFKGPFERFLSQQFGMSVQVLNVKEKYLVSVLREGIYFVSNLKVRDNNIEHSAQCNLVAQYKEGRFRVKSDGIHTLSYSGHYSLELIECVSDTLDFSNLISKKFLTNEVYK